MRWNATIPDADASHRQELQLRPTAFGSEVAEREDASSGMRLALVSNDTFSRRR